VLFVAGALLAGTALADTTTTTVETTTEQATTTVEPVTTIHVTTVRVTTTNKHIALPGPTTTAAASESETSTPWWAWVLVALGIGVLLALIFYAVRRDDDTGVALAERRRRLDGAVASWAAQGWALQSQTGDSAVVRRGSELMLISVDQAGQVTTQPLGPQ
jgi:DMSO reductase anchor subunit